MTEDEAKTKWCPHARTLEWQVGVARGADPQLIAASVNREPGDYDKEGNETVVVQGRHRCIASACMAWRWTTKGGDVVKADIKQLRKPPGEVNPPFSNTPEGYTVQGHDSWGYFSARKDEIVGHEPGQGFCGLAGSPS